MGHKYIKIPKIVPSGNGFFYSKSEAISAIKQYVIANINNFKDGESVFVKFVEDGKLISSHVFININETNDVSLSFTLDSDETLRIIETETEPDDKTAIWVTDSDDEKDVTIHTLSKEIDNLKETNKILLDKLNRLEYILSGEYDKEGKYIQGGVIAGGNFLTNSVKYELENTYPSEVPEDITEVYNDYTIAEEDFQFVDFEIYIGYSELSTYAQNNTMYRTTKYFNTIRLYNEEGEVIEEGDFHIQATANNLSGMPNVTIKYYEDLDKLVFFAESSGTSILNVTISDNSGTTVTKNYTILFYYNEEPDYKTYEEPNVKHVLIKSADDYDTLVENQRYLLLNELVWCISNSSLYIYTKTPSGTSYKLYKISGNGSTPEPEPPTGKTVNIEYKIIDGVLQITDTSDTPQVYVENGVLYLPGTLSDSILYLKDKNGGVIPTTEDEAQIEDGVLKLKNINLIDGALTFKTSTIENNTLIIQ